MRVTLRSILANGINKVFDASVLIIYLLKNVCVRIIVKLTYGFAAVLHFYVNNFKYGTGTNRTQAITMLQHYYNTNCNLFC